MKRLSESVRFWAQALVLTSGVVATPAAAQEAEGFAINRFEPSERGSEWFVTESLDFRGHGRPAMGVVLDGAYRPLVFRDDDGSTTALVERQISAHFGGSIVFWERLRLAGSLPVLLSQAGESAVIDGVTYPEPQNTAAGDLRLAADVRLFGEYRDAFSLAVGARAWLPTGDRNAYTGDEALRLGGHVLAAGEIEHWVYAARVGATYRGLEESFANSPIGTDLSFALSAGRRFLDDALVIGPEIFGSTVLVDGGFFDREATPLDLILGGHYTAGPWRFGAGAGPGLTRGIGSPAFRGMLSVEYIPKVEEAAAPLPVEPQKPCPEPADRDGDGILDEVDACPDQAGTPNSDPSQHGCVPPPDSDGDRIVDSEDSCPNEPGVKSAEPSLNGCPAPKDADGDGVLDESDACPAQAGPRSDDPARNGCPQVKVTGDRLEVLQRVEFATGSADLLAESHQILGEVARAIQTLPESARVRVEGHTDNRGGAAFNKNLSQKRAESVAKWLTTEGGIAAERLSAVGLGDQRPIVANDTAENRQTNRRVEFHILDSTAQSE